MSFVHLKNLFLKIKLKKITQPKLKKNFFLKKVRKLKQKDRRRKQLACLCNVTVTFSKKKVLYILHSKSKQALYTTTDNGPELQQNSPVQTFSLLFLFATSCICPTSLFLKQHCTKSKAFYYSDFHYKVLKKNESKEEEEKECL